MKKITLLLYLFSVVGFSQSLPLDFEVPEDNNFNGFNGTAATVVVDPTDATNMALEMVGAGVDFDGAALALDTYIDLSDDTNNTISLRIWAPDANTRTHLLKLEGGSSGVAELFFDATMMGFQTVNIDFGPNLGTEYPTLVIFTDSGAGNTANGTYYIDDITGPNGAIIPVDPEPATAAPDPTSLASEVLSIFSDTGGYTNIWAPEYSFGQNSIITLGSPANETYKFNLAAAGFGQGRNAAFDISAYNFLQFDYWADNNSTEIRFFMIDNNNGAVTEYIYEIGGAAPQEAIVQEAWTHVEVPLSFFETTAPTVAGGTGGFTKPNFFQWKIDASSDLASDFIFIDNIYFSQTTLSSETVELNVFTAYPNPSRNNWTITSADTTIDLVQVYDLTGKLVISQTGDATSLVVNSKNISQGMYVAKISSSNGVQNIKLIKE